jgi:hypothetical protein
MKLMKKLALALMLILIAMQFIRPDRNTAQGNHTALFLKETNPSTEVKQLLLQNCYDCHSNNTNYPWYNNIAPVSYYLADHIRHGKGNLNISEWGAYTDEEKVHKLEEISEKVDKGEMPLKQYTWMHEEAKLTEIQRTQIIEWAENTRILYQLGQQPK